MADSKTLCSKYEVTLDEDLKVFFAPLCALVSLLNVFLLYRTTNASLLSPQTTSIQNPILQIKERGKLDQTNHDPTHPINEKVYHFLSSLAKILCVTLSAALPELRLLSHNE